MSNRFDFSKIDEALPGAEKMQREERLANMLENNYKAVHALCDRMEKLENKLLEALPEMDGAVSSLREASKFTVSEEAKRMLEQEGETICRKVADRIDSESAKMLDRFSMKDRVVISTTAFWCMIIVITALSAFFLCVFVANDSFIHSGMLWKIMGYTIGFLTVCISLIIFTCYKLRL